MTMQRRIACVDCAVRQSALCQVLSSEQLSKLNRHSHHKRYPVGQVIAGMSAGEDWCATIVSGVIKLSNALPDGRQQIVGLLFPADFLGRPFKATSTYAAEAATDVELCCFSRRYFEQLLAEEPDLKQLFLERTLDQVDAAREWMLLLGCKTASEKVAALLLMIARRLEPAACAACSTQASHNVELPLSRSEMAEYLGLRLETVSRQLNRLEAAGTIKRFDRRGIVIRDMRGLEKSSGELPV